MMTSRTAVAASMVIGLISPALAVAGDPPAPGQGSNAKPAPEGDKGLEPPPPAEGSGAKPAADKGLEPPPPAEGDAAKPAGDGGLEPPPGGGDTGLSLDNPDLGAPPAGAAPTSGLGNIVIGGTLDYRVLVPSDMTAGMYEIHVNELFITTNIGDHIAILAEQLLLTSELGTTAGQDHGFVYATFSELPFLAKGMAIRFGRMRLRYGIDAKLDGPANPLRNTEYRTLGVLSDRALELGGFYGPIEYVAAIAMGPDFVLADAVGTMGTVIGTIKVPNDPTLHPIYARVGTDFQGTRPNIGLSGFYGDTYPVLAADGFQAGEAMLFGGAIDQHRVIRKWRTSIDVRWNWKKFKFAGEYTIGRDREDTGRSTVQAYFARVDYAVRPQKMSLQLQYDRFDDGRPGSRTVGSPGAAFTYNITEGSWLRAFAQVNERLLTGESAPWLAGTQLLMAF